MGFLSSIAGAVVKTALTPVAVLKDAVEVVTDEDCENTKDLLNKAKDNVMESLDELCDGDL